MPRKLTLYTNNALITLSFLGEKLFFLKNQNQTTKCPEQQKRRSIQPAFCLCSPSWAYTISNVPKKLYVVFFSSPLSHNFFSFAFLFFPHCITTKLSLYYCDYCLLQYRLCTQESYEMLSANGLSASDKWILRCRPN